MSEEIQKNSDDRIYDFLRPISGASILGLFAFAGAAFVFGSRYAGWIGGRDIGMVTAMFGGLAQLLAENKGPENLRSLVQINETALLENPLAAMRAGLRRASGGILLFGSS